MKKIILSACLFCSTFAYSQRIDTLLGLKGKLKYDTTISLPKTPLFYFNAFGNFGSLPDSVRAVIGIGSSYTNNGLFFANSTSTISQISVPAHAGMKLGWNGSSYVWQDTTASGGGSGVTSGTYASMIASTPTDGQRYSVSDYLPGPWTYATFDSNWHYMIAPTYSLYITNAFSSSIVQSSGSGSGWQNNVVDNTSRFGVSSLYNVGTTAAGYTSVTIGAGSSFSVLGTGGLWQSAMRVRTKISALSTSTDRFYFTVGASGATNGGGAVYGGNGSMYFLYSDSLNSGNWVCALGTGTSPTKVNTSVAADANYHQFVIMYKISPANTQYPNGGASSNLTAYYYIDKTLVATIPYSGSITTGSLNPFTGMAMHKTVGTTNVSFYLSEFSAWNYGQDR
jgi:hypothetical protein